METLEEAIVEPTWELDKINLIRELTKFREFLLQKQKESIQGLIKNINPE